MKALALALLTLSALVAGCASDAPTTPQAVGAEAEDGAPPVDGNAPAAADARVATFAVPTKVDKTLWLNGTFTLQEQGGYLADARQALGLEHTNAHVTDISADVPVGVPVRLVAEVDGQVGDGDIDLWFAIPNEDVWNMRAEAPFGGFTRIETHALRSSTDPIYVVVAYDDPAAAPEAPYALFVEVHADSDLLRAGVPVELPIAEGARAVELATDDVGEDAALVVWGPDDAFVGRFPLAQGNTTLPLPEDAPRGGYVVMLSMDVPRARLAVVGVEEAPRLKPVRQDIQLGDAMRTTSGVVEWTFSAARVPLQVGLGLSPGNVHEKIDVAITSPAGPLIGVVAPGGPVFYSMGQELWFTSRMGGAALVAGDYAARVDVGHRAGQEDLWVQHAVVYYART